jgi:nucleoid-associated protein YgaU
MNDKGELEKVKIQAFKKTERTEKDKVGEFVAYVNPNEITLSYEMEYDAQQGSGTTGSRMTFKKVKPGDLALSFFIDGTGASGTPADVQKEVEKFQTITGYNGDIHEPNYLMVAWGIQSNGVPLRAVITANFTDQTDDKTRVAITGDKSADLTHMRRVKAGDTLPLLCDEIYGDPFLYMEVARANGMGDFRDLVPGTKVFFPPLEKTP